MKLSRGFTVVELLIVVTILVVASLLFFTQKSQVEVTARDDMRKTSINAMYYSLEEVYFKNNQSYPRTLNSETLPSVDPNLFKDPSGVIIGESESDFRYEGLNCDGDSCSQYSLRTTLENEEDFVKTNRTTGS